MEHHINRRVILNTESEFKNLYPWSLQELNAEGEKIGRDQIPWAWTLYFTATELTLNKTLAIEADDRSDDDDQMALREGQSIRAKLTPGNPWKGERWCNTEYSMFGTDRPISTFELSIEKLEGKEERERCTVWGSVSYTSEVDFRDETTDDTLIFHLYIRPETFERYAAKIAASEVDEAVLRVGQVAGFYSDWSPSISTDEIKVLTSYHEHEVEIPKGCEIVPPRLGEVGKAELYLRRIRRLEAARIGSTNEDDGWLDEDELPTERPPVPDTHALERLATANTQAVILLSSLRTAAWVIAALLLMVLIT